ncbi:MAG TPA: hypothetical protein VFB43_03755 [Terracidiphilus sp.]|nr:hypothetical protein [Terracidiphilus sp.]
MGVWGTGIFEDDTACDVRGHYKDCLGDGHTGSEATRWILDEYQDLLTDPSEGGVIWLALASEQWKQGRLESETLEHALLVIDSGSDLNRWEAGSADHAARRAALEKLRVQITSPQPPEKKVARRVPAECHMKRGDLLAYELRSKSRIIFRVIDRFSDRGGTYPVCEILDWTGDAIPAKTTMKTLSTKRSRTDYKHVITQLMICRFDENSLRVQKLDFRLKPAQKDAGPTVVIWSHLDTFLAEWFLLE